MNTRILLVASAAIMLVAGLSATFLPQEILAAMGSDASAGAALIVQLAGALYLALGMINWMLRGVIIGGIYSRPLATGNFIHFAVAGIALVKEAGSGDAAFVVLAVIYVIFAGAFGFVLFTHPKQAQAGNPDSVT